ncbi:MAG: transcription antitermination factor NusB [Corynebacterium sp.]|nr:transcription antitermination factor NusB [Corynebacterium sp.]
MSDQPEKKQSKGKNFKRYGSRYKARRRAVDVLYEAEARDMDPVAIVADRVTLARVDVELAAPIASYTSQIVSGVAEELNRIDDVISGYLADDWELNRISAVDRAILRVALWELIFNPEVPVKTAVAEAVELASQYSGAHAPAYINVALDAAVKNIAELRQPPESLGEISFADALTQAEDEVPADDAAESDAPEP